MSQINRRKVLVLINFSDQLLNLNHLSISPISLLDESKKLLVTHLLPARLILPHTHTHTSCHRNMLWKSMISLIALFNNKTHWSPLLGVFFPVVGFYKFLVMSIINDCFLHLIICWFNFFSRLSSLSGASSEPRRDDGSDGTSK